MYYKINVVDPAKQFFRELPEDDRYTLAAQLRTLLPMDPPPLDVPAPKGSRCILVIDYLVVYRHMGMEEAKREECQRGAIIFEIIELGEVQMI